MHTLSEHTVHNLKRKSLDITVAARGLSGFEGSAECCGLVPSADGGEAHILQFDEAVKHQISQIAEEAFRVKVSKSTNATLKILYYKGKRN